MTAICLACNATTLVEPGVRDALLRLLTEEYGNEGGTELTGSVPC
jgi:hypothetical protein